MPYQLDFSVQQIKSRGGHYKEGSHTCRL